MGLLCVALGGSFCRPQPKSPSPMVVSLPYDLDSLEPGRRDRLSDFAVLSNLYEPLVTTDARLRLQPALADRWENPDEKTWVFHLRPGVRFHDGRLVTPRDVAFSFQRLAAKEELEARRHVAVLVNAEALDETRVMLRTETPMADFLNRVRFIHILPLDSTKEELERRPNGTGPYRFVRYDRKEIEVVRNASYWGPAPALERAVIRLNRNADDALADVLSGQSAFAQTNSFAALRAAESRPELSVVRGMSIAVKTLFFDVSRERNPHVGGGKNPFRDPRVREAVNLALDRRRLVGELPVPALPMTQLVPPFIFGYDADLPPPAADPARARALLEAAGWPSGFDVTLHTRSLLLDGATAIRTLLRDAGIRVTIQPLEEREFFQATDPEHRDFALALTRFGCPTGDAANFFDAAIHSTDTARGFGRVNAGGYESPEVDRLIEVSGRTLDPTLRLPLLKKVMRIAMQDLPWIPLYLDQDVYLFRAGTTWTPRLDNYALLAEISVR